MPHSGAALLLKQRATNFKVPGHSHYPCPHAWGANMANGWQTAVHRQRSRIPAQRQVLTCGRHDLSPAGLVQLGPSGWGVHDGVGAYTTIPWQQSRGAERCPIQSGPKPRNPSGSQYQHNSNPPPGRSISLQIHNNWVRQPYTRHPLAYTQGEGAED